MSINIKNLEDYKEYLMYERNKEADWIDNYAEESYSEFSYEAIRLSWKAGEVTTWVDNVEREGYDEMTRSWPAFIKKTVSKVWRWMETIETGGSWEVYEHKEDFHRMFNRCSCHDAQFVWYNTNNLCGKCFIEGGGCE